MAFDLFDSHPSIDLSRQEMQGISQAISSQFAPRYAITALVDQALPFSANELAAISAEISHEYMPRLLDSPDNLVLLPLSPGRLFAYWQVRQPAVEPATTAAAEQLTLRIVSQSQPVAKPPTAAAAVPQPPVWFDVAVDNAQSAQTLVLPMDLPANGPYSAALGLLDEQQAFTPLLTSKPIALHTPPAPLDLTPVLAQFMALAANATSPSGKLDISVPH